jgi:signal peptidase I
MAKNKMDRYVRSVLSWAQVIVFVLLLRAFVIQAYVIPTPSMEDTLLVGDALLVNRFVYGVKLPSSNSNLIPGRMPRRNEIIVFKYPFENRDFVKRCIAVEGDTVEIRDKVLYVNGEPADEPFTYFRDQRVYPRIEVDREYFQAVWENAQADDYYSPAIRDNFGPVVVPEDHVFAMGDNRDNSLDCRFWGPLHRKYLRGKPLFIYFSFDFPGGASMVDVFKIWTWRAVRLTRIGRLV